MAKRGRPRKTQRYTARHILSVPDINWGGRFDGPETVSNDVPGTSPIPDVKLLTVETDAQIDIVMKQSAEAIESRLAKLVAENPHWGKI